MHAKCYRTLWGTENNQDVRHMWEGNVKWITDKTEFVCLRLVSSETLLYARYKNYFIVS